MNIVAHNHQSLELLSSKNSHFLEEFHIEQIIKACNAYKVRGFFVKDIFQVAFENVFSSKSLFQKQRKHSSSIPSAKNTFYRFMSSNSINWRKLHQLFSVSPRNNVALSCIFFPRKCKR
ncbi:hypothetical protein SAMN02910356_00991 [Selenomonas sp. GACV-9]|uniref:hypothetical protein n=1 Tax=Selenomonas sp. GACV-9 TaxID=3158782 RepID=UPI0008E52226|nr:hypothetical protein SAMN02910356_00991 [Selenomonas ruminantium]